MNLLNSFLRRYLSLSLEETECKEELLPSRLGFWNFFIFYGFSNKTKQNKILLLLFELKNKEYEKMLNCKVKKLHKIIFAQNNRANFNIHFLPTYLLKNWTDKITKGKSV